MAKGEVLEVEQEPKALELRQPSMMDLIQVAIQNKSAMDVIERLTALQREQMAKEAESDFNAALNAAQGEVGRIAPDATNEQTKSKWATYAKLDRVLRPIYIRHGFSLSFNSGDSPSPDTVLVTCFVSHRGGHTRTYTAPPIPADGKGAKGGNVMTATHATGAAMSYGARYLLKYIFNIAVGEEDTDGNDATNGDLAKAIKGIVDAQTPDDMMKLYKAAYIKFEATPPAIKALIAARNEAKKEFDRADNRGN